MKVSIDKPKKTGLLRKTLCCNCLEDKISINPLTGEIICLNCRAINPELIRICIWIMPEPTGHEL